MEEQQKSSRGSEDARSWASELAKTFGDAVRLYRLRLGLSAIQLSNRTHEIGYPITRGTIAKIESNARSAKMDIAEVLVLAAALEVTPSDLAFSGRPDRVVRATPRVEMSIESARAWFNGDSSYNEFEQLQSPRVTQSRELGFEIYKYQQAVTSFEKRHDLSTFSDGRYYLTDSGYVEKDGQVTGYQRALLKKEYELIEELHDRVAERGGKVDLPPWFGTYEWSIF